MLIAISGSQGSGKSTTLNAIKSKGYNIIERKTSRSILGEWGVTLQEVNNDPDLTIKFQDEITKRKFLDEDEAVMSKELWFTERTHSDLFTYALVSLGKDNQYSEWLDQYYDTCKHLNDSYAAVCYLKAGHFDIEHDGVRGSSKHYSKMVDLVMLDFTKQMVDNNSLNIINTPDLGFRLNRIFFSAAGVIKKQ